MVARGAGWGKPLTNIKLGFIDVSKIVHKAGWSQLFTSELSMV